MRKHAVLLPAPRKSPKARMICFPYAGSGAAVYRLWPSNLPETVELVAFNPPGRGARLQERPLTSIPELVDDALASISPYLDLPFSMFGHSLGGVVALECVRQLESQGRSPVHLFVSSRPQRRLDEAQIHDLPEPDFIAAINARYQGIPAEILKHPDLLELLLPALRADMKAIETFRPDPGRTQIACPLTVFGGTADRTVSASDLENLREQTSSFRGVKLFPGDHFYIDAQRASLVSAILATLSHAHGLSGLSIAQ